MDTDSMLEPLVDISGTAVFLTLTDSSAYLSLVTVCLYS